MKHPAPLDAAIIGCGNISAAYLRALPSLGTLRLLALADANPQASASRAAEFGIPARSVPDLLADPDIALVINLTTPQSHLEVGLAALAAGKHVHSEKPLATRFSDGARLIAAARAAGRLVGCAPDTFLGGGHQTCRQLIDAGAIGTPLGGTAFFLRPGHESWHPNPDFYYQPGGGPMLDMGPYYLTALVNLLGPIESVAGMVSTPRSTRTIGSGPRAGQPIAVQVPTHVAGTLRFACGAIIQIATSFDVAGHRHTPIELYGTAGSLLLPDPNHFGGPVHLLKSGGEWQEIPVTAPFADGNFRGLGAADLAGAILADRKPRACGELALHVLEVMEAFGRSSETGRHIAVNTRAARPEAFVGLE